jgi:hypothetical protein
LHRAKRTAVRSLYIEAYKVCLSDNYDAADYFLEPLDKLQDENDQVYQLFNNMIPELYEAKMDCDTPRDATDSRMPRHWRSYFTGFTESEIQRGVEKLFSSLILSSELEYRLLCQGPANKNVEAQLKEISEEEEIIKKDILNVYRQVYEEALKNHLDAVVWLEKKPNDSFGQNYSCTPHRPHLSKKFFESDIEPLLVKIKSDHDKSLTNPARKVPLGPQAAAL